MAELIILRKGIKYTVSIDDDMSELLSKYRWSINAKGYVKGYLKSDRYDKRDYVQIHRVICGLKKRDGKLCDHRDGNPLNNKASNLRICNHLQNTTNAKPYGKSKFKGVHFYDRKMAKGEIKTYIVASITKDGKYKNLGVFDTEEEAARSYDKKAKEFFGEFARLNFPQDYGL